VGVPKTWIQIHNLAVAWTVLFHDSFDDEFGRLDATLQDEILAHARLLAEFGPHLGRPTVDTLKASHHANMKELRFAWKGAVWRVAFAFDPARQAVMLVGGDKGGADQRRFYQRLIRVADERYDQHLATLQAPVKENKEKPDGKKTR